MYQKFRKRQTGRASVCISLDSGCERLRRLGLHELMNLYSDIYSFRLILQCVYVLGVGHVCHVVPTLCI